MRSFWIGVVAGFAFLTAELAGRVLARVPTLPELVQDRLVLIVPGQVFSFLLDRLHYGGKPVLFVGLILLQLMLAGVGSLAFAHWRHPVWLTSALWFVTGLVVLPLAGQGVFASSPGVALVTLLAFALYTAALIAYTPEQPTATGQPGAAATEATANRRLLVGGIVTFLLSLVLGERLVQSSLSEVATVRPALPPPVTPVDHFYIVSKNLVDPVVDPDTWHLTVDGLVDRALDLRYADVLALPARQAYQTLECISNDVGGDLISNGLWTGVPLVDVLRRAGVRPGATVVHFTCVDGYTENMSLAKALSPTTLLAYQLNRQPLPSQHGFPLRVLGTDTYGMKNSKWLTRLTIARSASPGFWEQQGWSDAAIVRTMSKIVSPKDGAVLRQGTIDVGGIAFAGARGIRRVEISADGGRNWVETKLLPALGPNTWVFWEYAWQPARPGDYTLLVRATDGSGRLQQSERTDPFPDGATGYHQVTLRITAA
jgi:DMSO/TMAO reductase YedYZ molybdopterin-dependent catalytic subunit